MISTDTTAKTGENDHSYFAVLYYGLTGLLSELKTGIGQKVKEVEASV